MVHLFFITHVAGSSAVTAMCMLCSTTVHLVCKPCVTRFVIRRWRLLLMLLLSVQLPVSLLLGCRPHRHGDCGERKASAHVLLPKLRVRWVARWLGDVPPARYSKMVALWCACIRLVRDGPCTMCGLLFQSEITQQDARTCKCIQAVAKHMHMHASSNTRAHTCTTM